MKRTAIVCACLACSALPGSALETSFASGAWRIVCEPGQQPAQSRCSLEPSADTTKTLGLATHGSVVESALRARADGSTLTLHADVGSPCIDTTAGTLDVRFISGLGDTLRTIRARPARGRGHVFTLDTTALAALPYDGSLELDATHDVSQTTRVSTRRRYPFAGFRDAAGRLLQLPKR